MKLVYASRTGNVESLVNKLNADALNNNDAHGIAEDYILVTYTDGAGEVPFEVDEFLAKNQAHLKAVIASGNMAYGDDNFCKAGEIIADSYGVPLLYKVEDDGTDEDIAKIAELI